MIVSKQIEWDMGHRVLNHHSKCSNLHGHRYKAEICLKGNLVSKAGDSSEGMVIDFGDIKLIATKYVHDVLDHGFMVWGKDKVMLNFFSKNAHQKHIVVPFTPTAENISAWIFRQLDTKYTDIFNRLHFCNLACGRDRGWKCDTKYTWDNRSREFWQEPIDMKPEDVAKAAEESWSEAFGDASGHRVVVTGGEPLLQQKKLALLFSFLPNWAVEIETNGTIAPLPELSDCQFNCSPKLANSGNTVDRRYR